MPLTEADALYAAAYKVVLEVLDPDGCATEQRLATLVTAADRLREWSSGLSAELSQAYARAVTDIVDRARKVRENNVRAGQMIAAYAAIPRPPTADVS